MKRRLLVASDSKADEPEPSLLERIRKGDEAAMRELYARHAGLVFSIAARIVSKEEAEEIVQELFFLLWQKPESFDPNRGAFAPWIARVARNRALNEQRRRKTAIDTLNKLDNTELSDSPRTVDSNDSSADIPHIGDAASIHDGATPADEALWAEHRREILRAAVDALPPAQQRAVSLAFFEELPHSKVASVLGAPVGTVKTRIRLGLRRLSILVAAAAVSVLLAAFFLVARNQASQRLRVEGALRMVTASDVVPLHLSAQAGVPAEAHGGYRARPGVGIGVLTTSSLPMPLPEGSHYVGWVMHGELWSTFGPLLPASDGRSVSIAEGELFALPPDEIRVTRESSLGRAPTGALILEWKPASR